MEFTNLVEINTLELRKLPTDDDSTELWYWMQFIRSDNEEVLEMLAQRSPAMRKAVGVLKELSADERSRMLFESREMARMDFESRVDGARAEGLAEGRAGVARNLFKTNLSIEQIVTATGLTREEIEALKQAE
jgi:predicted transposase/invertase (TIGR01784 family)